MNPLPPQLIVFDLDGTLIDSRTDLCNSVNAALVHLKRSPLSDAVISSYVGDGAAALVRRSLAHDSTEALGEELVQEALDFFLRYYRAHKLDFTYVYPGVIETLEEIQRRLPGVPMAVLTNKPVGPSRDICRHFGLDRFFFQNYGGDSFPTKKPDPAGLRTLIAEGSAQLRVPGRSGDVIEASRTVMVGDSDVDILTARNCGSYAVGCVFEFAPGSLREARPDLLAHAPADWLRLLDGQ
jgi:phosphoglycolate phosphatase